MNNLSIRSLLYRSLLILSLATITAGCSSLNTSNPRLEWLTAGDTAYGDRAGDVCISCGENFTFIPNQPFNAQRTRDLEGKASY
jgi:hypothetical protein